MREGAGQPVLPFDLLRRTDVHSLHRIRIGNREGHARRDVVSEQAGSAYRGASVCLRRGNISGGARRFGKQRYRRAAGTKEQRREVEAAAPEIAMVELRDFQTDALGEMPDFVDSDLRF